MKYAFARMDRGSIGRTGVHCGRRPLVIVVLLLAGSVIRSGGAGRHHKQQSVFEFGAEWNYRELGSRSTHAQWPARPVELQLARPIGSKGPSPFIGTKP